MQVLCVVTAQGGGPVLDNTHGKQKSQRSFEDCVELNSDGPHRFSHFFEGPATGGFWVLRSVVWQTCLGESNFFIL